MKKNLCLLFILANGIVASSQEFASLYHQANLLSAPNNFYLNQNRDYSISRFALSINPLGFVEFGPLINAEVGLSKKLVLNAHVRFTTLGVLTYVVKSHEDGLDKLTGMAYGGGVLYFFGEKRSKPYVGMFMDYEKTKNLYAEDESWEWTENDNTIIFMFNGGYRFRFKSGFFINTGAFLGVGYTLYDWKYTDDSDEGEGNDVTPAGLLELAIGYEF